MTAPTAAVPDGAALLTPQQARTVIQVSMVTLRKLGRDGALVPVRIGRALRYRRTEVEAYICNLTAGR
jgi:hypothetical protein